MDANRVFDLDFKDALGISQNGLESLITEDSPSKA